MLEHVGREMARFMHAASQQTGGTMLARSGLVNRLPPTRAGLRAVPMSMSPPKPRQFYIRGITAEGRTFRPSDWAERLAGAMASFRPGGGGKAGIGAYIGYSPYCVPQVIDGVKCVIVSEALKDIELMAWDFVMNFARDNHLAVQEADALPPAY
jgi:hypothetical protein